MTEATQVWLVEPTGYEQTNIFGVYSTIDKARRGIDEYFGAKLWHQVNEYHWETVPVGSGEDGWMVTLMTVDGVEYQ